MPFLYCFFLVLHCFTPFPCTVAYRRSPSSLRMRSVLSFFKNKIRSYGKPCHCLSFSFSIRVVGWKHSFTTNLLCFLFSIFVLCFCVLLVCFRNCFIVQMHYYFFWITHLMYAYMHSFYLLTGVIASEASLFKSGWVKSNIATATTNRHRSPKNWPVFGPN